MRDWYDAVTLAFYLHSDNEIGVLRQMNLRISPTAVTRTELDCPYWQPRESADPRITISDTSRFKVKHLFVKRIASS
jgi:hypothetical protein